MTPRVEPLLQQSPIGDAAPPSTRVATLFLVLRPSYFALWRANAPRWVHELSGAMGDLGTFLPLTTVLAHMGSVNFGIAMFFAGIYNLLTVLWFDVPVPVQPMHTITAVAVADGLTGAEIAGAGLAMGGAVLTLGVSQLIEVVNAHCPTSIVRGIQLSLGLGLIIKGSGRKFALVTDPNSGHVVLSGIDSVLTSALLAVAVLLFARSRRVPIALLIFLFGAIVTAARHGVPPLHPGLAPGNVSLPIVPSPREFASGVWHAALPQLPLTLLNSVVATAALSRELFGDGRPCGVTRLATSIGALNLAFCWLGAVPSCHGAGGLAAQHRFGARTSLAMLLLGLIKCSLALTFGASLQPLVHAFPKSVLGVLLGFSGLELALKAMPPAGVALAASDLLVMLVTAGFGMQYKTGVAFVVGTLTWLLLAASRRIAALTGHGGSAQEAHVAAGTACTMGMAAAPECTALEHGGDMTAAATARSNAGCQAELLT